MYLPSHFREDRPEVLDAFVRAHPLGLLVTVAAGVAGVDAIPMQLERDGGGAARLRGHVARANPVVAATPAGTPVLVVFGGAQHYITPSWYAAKQVDGRVVPTWNYSLVHVRGRIRWLDAPAELRALVGTLTDAHEAPRAAPWSVDDAPAPYVAGMLAAIVGFEIEVDSMLGKFKGSQNRSAADRAGVAAGLAEDGTAADAVAELVRAPRAGP